MKYYRVKKDTFVWKEGAIIKKNEAVGIVCGYKAIEDIWDVVPSLCLGEIISSCIIEHEQNKEFFERVYPDTVAGKIFRTKDELVDFYKKNFE